MDTFVKGGERKEDCLWHYRFTSRDQAFLVLATWLEPRDVGRKSASERATLEDRKNKVARLERASCRRDQLRDTVGRDALPFGNSRCGPRSRRSIETSNASSADARAADTNNQAPR